MQAHEKVSLNTHSQTSFWGSGAVNLTTDAVWITYRHPKDMPTWDEFEFEFEFARARERERTGNGFVERARLFEIGREELDRMLLHSASPTAFTTGPSWANLGGRTQVA